MAIKIQTDTDGTAWPNSWSQMEYMKRSFMNVGLQNYNNNDEPQIVPGSVITCWDGSDWTMYYSQNYETISGWGGIGSGNDAYIRLIPIGATASYEWTTTTPLWSTVRYGYYDALTITKRYIGKCYKVSGSVWQNKILYEGRGYPSKFEFHDLDDVPDGSTYKKTADVNGNGHPSVIANNCAFEGAQTRYFAVCLASGGVNWDALQNRWMSYRGAFCGWTGSTGSASGYLAVNLPHGAIVTSFYVNSDSGVSTYLKRSILTGTSNNTMATVAGTGTDSSIDYATIDNNSYKYYIYTTHSSGTHDVNGIYITYTIIQPEMV